MTSLTPLADESTAGDIRSVSKPGARLTALIEHLMEATAPIAFQVVFERRNNWQADSEIRKEDIVDGRDTLSQRVGAMIAGEYGRDQVESRVDDSVEKRIEYIDAKNPKRSFTTNIRAIGVPTEETRDDLDARMDSLLAVFDPLDGPFYEIHGKRLRDDGFREKKKTKNARAALRRLVDRDLATGRGRTRPELTLCGSELANFVLVPSSEKLTVEGERGTRAEQQSRNPLPLPNPDHLQQFQEGMAIGYPLDETGDPRSDPVRVPPESLTTHYTRLGSTGSGKSISMINDALSLRETTGGPVAIVDQKGDGMCENYLQCHYERFDSLDDVRHFQLPEIIPAFSFFDIRPALASGRRREDAIQDKVVHFHDILRMIMGREQYEQAFVANEILSYLIKALFDEDYGSDAFGLDDLFDAALLMQREQVVPPLSEGNQNIEESLTRHFAKDDHQFQVSMDAVGNRLDKLREDAHLRRIFSHVPEQDDDGEYVDNRFDFRDLLDEDVTILFDLGDLRPEAQRAITLLLLSNLWDAVQVRRRDDETDYENITNLIIEEAAPVASTSLVSEQLLPQGRSFGLSLGLVMQFSEQVRYRNERAYDEVLNNIRTKLIGNISIEGDLAESLAHEDLSPTELRNRLNRLPSGEWIAELPNPSFGETGPTPFSLKPLPIPPGHPESDQPLAGPDKAHFESLSKENMVERTQAQYGLTKSESGNSSLDGDGWGSSGKTNTKTSSGGSTDEAPTKSAFIGQETNGSSEVGDQDDPMAEDREDPELGELKSVVGTVEPDDRTEQRTQDQSPTLEESPNQPENSSKPIKSAGVTVTDEELRRRGLSHDDVRFLSRVLDVMNGEDTEYTLLDSMRGLRDEFENLDLDRLYEQNLVDEGSAAGRKYYTVLPAGRELLGEKLQVGPGQGDIGEKSPHKVGVKLLELWLQQQENVTRVESYYEHEETLFDVAGFDADEMLVWVGEAELSSNNVRAPVDDYDKMSEVEAEAVWAFNDRETAIEVLDRLEDADRIEQSVSGRDARSFTAIQDTVEEFDAPGLTTIRSFKKLDQGLDP